MNIHEVVIAHIAQALVHNHDLTELRDRPGFGLVVEDRMQQVEVAHGITELGCRPFLKDGETEHTHDCPDCFLSWSHCSSVLYTSAMDEDTFEDAHRCPRCGARQDEGYSDLNDFDYE